MAGTLMSLLPKRVYDFGTLVVGTSQSLSVVDRIDISQYIDGIVILRVHSVNAAGGTITFDLMGDGETEEDPGLIFRTSSPFFTAAQITSSTTAPTVRSYGGTIRGHFAALRVTGSRSSGSPVTATVSVDLVLRTPDNAM